MSNIMLSAALDFVKDTVGQGDTYASYTVRNGLIYSTDQIRSACCPVNIRGNFMIPARELEIACTRMPGATAEFQGDALVVKQGRSRATIATRPIEIPPPDISGELIEPSEHWRKIIKPLAELAEDTARQAWMTAILCFADSTATIGEKGGFFAISDIPLFGGRQLLLPGAAARFFASNDTPSELFLGESWIAARWPDGSGFRSQLITGDVPEIVHKRLMDAKITNGWELPKEWTEAVASLVKMIGPEGSIIMGKNGMQSDRGQLHAEDDTPTPTPGNQVCMRTGIIKRLLDHADTIQFSGDLVRWKGKVLRGLAATQNV